MKREFPFVVSMRFFRILRAVQLKIAAILQLVGSTAIPAVGNRPFEIGMSERMVPDLDRQTLILGIS